VDADSRLSTRPLTRPSADPASQDSRRELNGDEESPSSAETHRDHKQQTDVEARVGVRNQNTTPTEKAPPTLTTARFQHQMSAP